MLKIQRFIIAFLLGTFSLCYGQTVYSCETIQTNSSAADPSLITLIQISTKYLKMPLNVLLLGIYFLPDGSKSNEIPPTVVYKTVKTLKGDLIVKLSANGVVEPNFKVEVKSKASGKVLTFPFKEGDHIKKGQALLQLNKNVCLKYEFILFLCVFFSFNILTVRHT